MVTDLRALVARHPDVKELTDNLAYLAKREAQMQYPTFQAAGWPIGSGCVESANKVVVEARLKGAGMHWERHNVNPMLVLRNAVCNGRWDETWQASTMHRQHTRQQQRGERTQARCEQAVARFLKLVLWYKPPTPRLRVEAVARPVSHPTSAPVEVAPGSPVLLPLILGGGPLLSGPKRELLQKNELHPLLSHSNPDTR